MKNNCVEKEKKPKTSKYSSFQIGQEWNVYFGCLMQHYFIVHKARFAQIKL